MARKNIKNNGIAMGKYTIGVDFGTLSGRSVLIDVSNGDEVATAMLDYPHGVLVLGMLLV